MRKERIPRAQWRRMVAAWKASGLSADEFAARHGDAITGRNLAAWERKFRNGATDSSAPELRFVEIGTADRGSQAPRTVIRLPSGLRVCLPSDFAVDRVAALIRALEEK